MPASPMDPTNNPLGTPTWRVFRNSAESSPDSFGRGAISADAVGGTCLELGPGRLGTYDRPLPDAVAIDLVPVPVWTPPYDDDLAGADLGEFAIAASAARKVQESHPRASGDAPAYFGPSAAADATRRPGSGGQAPDRPAPLRDPPGHWPSQFAQVLAETLAGSRPPSQLAPWTTDQARRRISRLGPVLSTTHRPRVKRVIVTSPAGGVLEMAIVVMLGTRVRALAVRLERTQHPGDQSRPHGQQHPADRPDPGSRPKQPDRSKAPGWVCTAIEAA